MNLANLSGPFWWMIGFRLFAGVGSIGLSAPILMLPARGRQRVMPYLLSFFVGTLLGAAFQGLLPHALDAVPAPRLFPVFLAGVIGFMFFERVMLWRHCHEGRCEAHTASGTLILVATPCTTSWMAF